MSPSQSIAFVTLGCAKNEVDTDKMQARLSAAGFQIVDDCSTADLVVVNTCAFLSTAVEESLEVIFTLANGKRADGSKPKVLVAGCMPSRYGTELEAELVEASGFIAAGDEERIAEVVTGLLKDTIVTQPDDHSSRCIGKRFRNGVSAYVKISDGCDRFCSYCMIPHIRGRYHSYDLDDICTEVDELVESGVREIVLIGQDTGIWGYDLDVPDTTSHLLDVLAASHPDTWFRILYVQPEGIDDELLAAISRHDNICDYVDMPLQHSDEEVIERMNRKGCGKDYLKLVEHVRDTVPGIMVRTTLMTGFPGETIEQFESLLDFAEQAEFDYAAVFPFSPEEGSAAYGFDGQVDEEERMDRAQRLMDLCESIGTSRVADLVGQRRMVLVEGYEETDVGLEALCRTQGQAPEVDGQVHVPIANQDELPIGEFAEVLITGSFFYELEGELLDS